jgi:hypothetical protein
MVRSAALGRFRIGQNVSVVLVNRMLRVSLHALLIATAAGASAYVVLGFARGAFASLRDSQYGSPAFGAVLASVALVGAGIAWGWGRSKGDRPLRLAQRVMLTSLAVAYLLGLLVLGVIAFVDT